MGLAVTKDKGKEVFAGPHIKTYNDKDAEFLKDAGIKGLCFPVELPRDSIKNILGKNNLEGEIFAHGKAPLAFSWRCYTERAYNLTKEKCQHHCIEHPEGMELRTSEKPEGDPVFTISGTSILSGKVLSLIEFTEDLNSIGITSLRISPQYKDTEKIISIFKRTIDKELTQYESAKEISTLTGGAFTNGYYQGKAGKDFLKATELGAS
jgi:collagenase-like PrtC family protease